MKTKLKWTLLAGLLGVVGLKSAEAANPVDGTITVTPVATVSLTLAPTTYAFGPVAVAISTVAISSVTLTNNGTVSATVDKRIQTQSAPAGWTASTSVGADTYVLSVSTSLTVPTHADFAAGHRFGAESNVSNLTGLAGTQPTLGVNGTADLWFKLDMPSSVTSQAARTITVRFTGTAQ